jgi:hypothetical protein
MSEKKEYQCVTCKKRMVSRDGSTPTCCGQPMKQLPLDICLQPAHAEHARPMNDEDACDEFRAG